MNRPSTPSSRPPPARDEDQELRLREREWQNRVGHALLDKPFEDEGSAFVFQRQFERVERAIGVPLPGPLVEVGAGRGQFLGHLRRTRVGRGRLLVGVDVSVAVRALPARGAAPVRADGEALPFRDESVAVVVYNGSLHHVVDYRKAVAEAFRVLRPGGRLVVFEPSSTVFNRVVHRVLDPIVFRAKVEYESPVDRFRKHAFSEAEVVEEILRFSASVVRERSDFLAYPVTGCYAGSALARFPRLMKGLVDAERAFEESAVLGPLSRLFSWRFLAVADKPFSRDAAFGDTVRALTDILVCPRCRGPLEKPRVKEGFYCPKCRVVYRVEHGVPVLIVEEAERPM
ncbi:MAG TPA: methyltransferase domain-containing protein [Polyangiaceae bacterium]|nr:methyltransferase domain-containing protein [Polyangiaceae bacterium]